MEETLITCRNLSFSYDNVTVVQELNFCVDSGDYLCIVGENGAGKSTLMKGILGLKQPSEGEIIYSGNLKKNEIGYLPQQTNMQRDFPASVYEAVISGCLNKHRFSPFYSKEDKLKVSDIMNKLGITDIKDHCYRELSGGQQQRVLLARALCATEKVLLLDEPVTGLDPAVTIDMYHLISQINNDLGITIIMISHDIQSACRYASKILHVNKKQVFFGSTEDYIKSGASNRFLDNDK
ncbi:metal ABC transporter ATP-binding protein [Porcipelethomonas sp.]|uniref:metal ABC transporter ATP-binding protein n=1 Tax=Porcipelethomonas sp. TaxID=2981675 RepID=UPI003EFA5D27